MPDFDAFSDEEIVAIVREENKQLYRTLVERYEAKLKRYAMVFVKDNDAVEDIVQNAFIKAFVNLQGFNVKKKFSSWIYRIVHNEAINFIKKHKRELPIDDVPEVQVMPTDDEHEDERIDREDALRLLKETMSTLPLNYREPLELFFVEEKSYEEISDILHMPIGTVGTRINRGKGLLKSLSSPTP